MQEVEIEGIVFFAFLFGIIILGFVLIIYVIAMHNIMYKRFDPILFREPWFSSAELVMYSAWPLSLVKTVQYMFLISMPNYARRRRFKGVTRELEVLKISKALRIACHVYTVIHSIAFIIGTTWLLMGAWVLIFLDG